MEQQVKTAFANAVEQMTLNRIFLEWIHASKTNSLQKPETMAHLRKIPVVSNLWFYILNSQRLL